MGLSVFTHGFYSNYHSEALNKSKSQRQMPKEQRQM